MTSISKAHEVSTVSDEHTKPALESASASSTFENAKSSWWNSASMGGTVFDGFLRKWKTNEYYAMMDLLLEKVT